jgi:plastocyanin
MLKRLAPALVLALGAVLLLIPTSAPAATAGLVAINGYDYTPKVLKVQQGATVTWKNNNSSFTAHTATSNQKFWDSQSIAGGGGTFSETNTFLNAGTYGYHCTIHSFMAPGKVQVPIKATGSSTTGYTLQWSSLPTVPTNRTFDVWIKKPGSTKFVAWKTATTTRKSGLFNPAKTGTYYFEARTNIVPGTRHSDWSPALKIVIT